jgi:hypothetical protein
VSFGKDSSGGTFEQALRLADELNFLKIKLCLKRKSRKELKGDNQKNGPLKTA